MVRYNGQVTFCKENIGVKVRCTKYLWEEEGAETWLVATIVDEAGFLALRWCKEDAQHYGLDYAWSVCRTCEGHSTKTSGTWHVVPLEANL